MAMKCKIRKGDQVVVISGSDKGRRGEVLKVLREDRRVLVRGINVVKRHTRPRPGQPGGIVDLELPIHVSNVAHLDPKTDKPTRTGYKFAERGRKVRIARRSGEAID